MHESKKKAISQLIIVMKDLEGKANKKRLKKKNDDKAEPSDKKPSY
tara:strand:- start:1068 stop:1205 length:138 start_codon:yes stop_codon:yes gene_type:complete